jgi:hypothetical protein
MLGVTLIVLAGTVWVIGRYLRLGYLSNTIMPFAREIKESRFWSKQTGGWFVVIGEGRFVTAVKYVAISNRPDHGESVKQINNWRNDSVGNDGSLCGALIRRDHTLRYREPLRLCTLPYPLAVRPPNNTGSYADSFDNCGSITPAAKFEPKPLLTDSKVTKIVTGGTCEQGKWQNKLPFFTVLKPKGFSENIGALGIKRQFSGFRAFIGGSGSLLGSFMKLSGNADQLPVEPTDGECRQSRYDSGNRNSYVGGIASAVLFVSGCACLLWGLKTIGIADWRFLLSAFLLAESGALSCCPLFCSLRVGLSLGFEVGLGLGSELFAALRNKANTIRIDVDNSFERFMERERV